MAGNQAVVEFLLQWSEQGGQLPEKVKRDLDRMGQSSSRATSITDKLGQALTRLERREPPLFMRQIRGAVDNLAASAIGATGPVGRLAVSLAGLAPGGALTLAGLGGLAVLGLEIKALVNVIADMEKGLRAANSEFAKMVGGAAALRDQLATLQDQEAAQPNIFMRGLARLGQVLPGQESDLETALQTGRAAEQTGIDLRAGQVQRRITAGHAETIRRHEEELRRAADERLRAFNKAVEEAIRTDTRRLQDRRFETPRLAGGFAIEPPTGLRGPAPQLATSALADESQARFNDRMEEYAQLLENMIPLQQQFDMAVAQLRADTAAGLFPAEQLDAAIAHLNETMLKGGRSAQISSAQMITAFFGMLQAAQGGFGGLLSGIGGIVGIGNPLLGAALGGLGGFISASESRGVRVDEYGARAIDQMRQARQGPDNVTVQIISPTGELLDEFIYEQGRRTRRDAVDRVPPRRKTW